MSGEILEMIFAFPFKQIGGGLRALSLASVTGNILAWILYVSLCLIPVAIYVLKAFKKKSKPEDGLLIVISAALFYVMYVMINPSLVFYKNYLMEDYTSQMAIFGGILYSIIIGYMVLKLVRTFKEAEKNSLCKWLHVLLVILNLIIAVNTVSGADTLIENIDTVKESNYSTEMPSEYVQFPDEPALTGLQDDLNIPYYITLTNVFLVMRYVVEVITCITTIMVVVFVQKFLKEFDKTGVSQETIAKATKVQHVAVNAVIINILANIVYNLTQLAFYKNLLSTNAIVELPLLSLLFILAMPLITKLLTTSKEIKDENDMFV